MKPGGVKPFASRFRMLVAGVVLAVVIGLFVINHDWTPMPVYQGKTEREWVSLTRGSHALQAYGVLHDMGSNAVPYLVGELWRRDTRLDRFYQRNYGRLPARLRARLKEPIPQRQRWYDTANTLAYVQSSTAIPPLTALLTKGNDEQQWAALFCLVRLVRPQDTNCVPALINCLKSNDAEVADEAASVLQRMQLEKLAVPVLTNRLNSRDIRVRRQALFILGRIDTPNAAKWNQMYQNELSFISNWRKPPAAPPDSAKK